MDYIFYLFMKLYGGQFTQDDDIYKHQTEFLGIIFYIHSSKWPPRRGAMFRNLVLLD